MSPLVAEPHPIGDPRGVQIQAHAEDAARAGRASVRRRGLRAVCCSVLGMAAMLPALCSAQAHGYKRKTLAVIHPWTFDQTEPGTRDAIVGMTLRNGGGKPDRLVGATTTIADGIEIKGVGSLVAGATARQPKVIELKPGQEVQLKASGAHVRLIGLKKPLVAYDTLPVTLIFERAGRLTVDVLVEELPPRER